MRSIKKYIPKIEPDKAIMILIVLFVFVLPAFFGDPFQVYLKEKEVQEHIVDRVQVEYVIDGDTIVTTSGEKVRLLGIDTPERGEPYYDEATRYLEDLLQDKEIRLEKDISVVDKYGRSLYHVYVDDTWVNKRMVEEGWARMLTIPPDVMHVREFEVAQEQARENKWGIWKDI